MSDEFSTRDDVEQDLQDIKDTVAKPLKNKIENEVGDKLSKVVADQGAKIAEKAAAETAAASTGAMAGATALEGATGASTVGASAAGAGATAGVITEGAAAGTAAGPVGIAIGAAVATGSQLLKKFSISIDEKDTNSPKISIVTIIACALLFLFILCGTLISKGISGMFSIGHETEFEQDVAEGKGMAPAGEQYMEGTDPDTLTYDYSLPLRNTINMYVYGTENKDKDSAKGGDGTVDGFRAALDQALRKHCKNLIDQLDKISGGINGHGYDNERSLETFYNNQYPYDLATPSFVPRIGNVLGVEGYEAYAPKYDDVNFAEVIAILSMSSNVEGSNYGFDWGNGNFQDFMAFTQKEECYRNLYELGLKWVPIYVGYIDVEIHKNNTVYHEKQAVEVIKYKYDSADECRDAPEEIVENGVTCTFDKYFVEVTVKPFGLRELFSMAFGGDPEEAANRMHVNFYEHSNLYMLDYSERVTRMYQRGQKKTIHTTNQGDIIVDALGPPYKEPRSIYSSIYNELLNDAELQAKGLAGCGRSCWSYIDITYNDKFEVIEWPDDPQNIDVPDGESFIPPEGENILKMYEYLNQGVYSDVYRGLSNETIKQSGCLDCSVAMIVMYYMQQNVDITEISAYVNKSGALRTGDALNAYGLAQGENTYTDFKNGVINEINNNRPTIVHIKGNWTSSAGESLHSTENGHFLVAYGYDDAGIYVLDPGNRKNTYVLYEDWGTVNELYYRPVYQK